jgi:hypothetical protein
MKGEMKLETNFIFAVIAIMSESSNNDGLGVFVPFNEVLNSDLDLLNVLSVENKDIALKFEGT